MLRHECDLHISAHTRRRAFHLSRRCSTRYRSQLRRSRLTLGTLPGYHLHSFRSLASHVARRFGIDGETVAHKCTLPSRLNDLLKLLQGQLLPIGRIIDDEYVQLLWRRSA